MSLTQEQIARLAQLTALTHGQKVSIDSVIDSFGILEQADTSHITEATRSGEKVLHLRDDIVRGSGLSDALLECSHQKKAAHQIVLSGIIAGE